MAVRNQNAISKGSTEFGDAYCQASKSRSKTRLIREKEQSDNLKQVGTSGWVNMAWATIVPLFEQHLQ